MTDNISEFSEVSSSTIIKTSESYPQMLSDAEKKKKIQKVKGANAAKKKLKQACGNYMLNTCSFATLKRKLPIISWLPNYRLSFLKSDLIAGFTVGLTVIPQGMAYASLAGLDLKVNKLMKIRLIKNN